MPRTIQLQELAKKPTTFGKVKQWSEQIMNYIFETSQDNLVTINPNVSRHVISDTGFLMRSGVPPYWKDNKLIMEYQSPYGIYIEYGSEPHFVPHTIILNWVKRKLGFKGKKANRVAWAIVNKIRKRGIQPKPFLRNAIHSAIRKYNLRIKGPD